MVCVNLVSTIVLVLVFAGSIAAIWCTVKALERLVIYDDSFKATKSGPDAAVPAIGAKDSARIMDIRSS